MAHNYKIIYYMFISNYSQETVQTLVFIKYAFLNECFVYFLYIICILMSNELGIHTKHKKRLF